jgi:hypothetical protein
MRTRAGDVATLMLAGCALAGALGSSSCGAAPSGGGVGGMAAALAGDMPVTKGIIQDDKGTPLAGAKIEAHPANGGRTVVTATSAADGTFDLAASTGTYNILVTPRTQFAPQKFLGHTITAGSHLDLILVDHREKMLAGHITDQHGQPFPFARVCTLPDLNGCIAPDATGAFQVTVAVGTTLTVFGGTNFVGTFNGSLTVDRSTGPIVNIVVPQFNVTGTIVDQDGNPVRGNIINVQSCPTVDFGGVTGSFCPGPFIEPDDAGRFNLLMGPGTTPLLVVLQDQSKPFGFLVQQFVTGDAAVTFQVPPIERLSGRVVGSDGNGVPRELVCPTIDGCRTKTCFFATNCAVTDDDGQYQLDLFAGAYDVDAEPPSSSPGGLGFTTTGPVPVFGPTGLDFLAAPSVKLQDPVMQAGQVLAVDGSGLAGAQVCFSATTPLPGGCTDTDVNGGYQLSLVPGLYSVTVSVGLPDPTTFSLGQQVAVPSAIAPIHLLPSAHPTGQLFQSDGRPLSGVQVSPSPGCFSNQVPGGSQSFCGAGGGTDEAGRFAISALGGSSVTLQIALTDKAPVVDLPVLGVPIVGDDTDLLIGIESGLLGTGPQPLPTN